MIPRSIACLIASGSISYPLIEGQAPSADPAIFAAKVPVLGICYGEQTMAQQLGGTVVVSNLLRVGHYPSTGSTYLLGGGTLTMGDG